MLRKAWHLNIFMLNTIMLTVIMLTVIVLTVVMLRLFRTLSILYPLIYSA